MMRLISAFLCFCLTFNVMAASGTVTEFERMLDEYQYALTVEWDQKDAAFMQEKTANFYDSLAMMMDKGLSSQQVMDVVAKKVKNPEQLKALKLQMSLLADKATTSAELANLIKENSKSLYATGASWDGYVFVSIGAGVLIAALVGYAIWWDSKHECVATSVGQQCGWVSYYQGGQQYYQCWQTTYCSQYAEK